MGSISTPRDYSVFNKFNFERKPVGVKFLIVKPEIRRLDKELNLCEMLREAQESSPFYAGREDFQCVEPIILGMEDFDSALVSGQFAAEEDIFKEARAAWKMYQHLPKMLKDSVRYVALSPIDQLPFDPDVLVITANVSQAQTLLRSIGYSTGDLWSSRGTPVISCSWIFIYPVVSGEMNFTITGLALGMQKLDVFPPGLILISVPWKLLPTMTENLQEMPWGDIEPPPGGDAHRQYFKRTLGELRQRLEKQEGKK